MNNVGFKITTALAVFWLSAFAPLKAVAQQKEPTITVRLGKSVSTYTGEQLRAMATDTLPNLKGTRKKPAIPLETLLLKNTGVKPDKIHMVFILGDKITILRGSTLAYLGKMVIATGPEKGGKPHKWSLAPKDEETYKAVYAQMGSRRKGNIYRIDIVLKDDAV